MGYSWKHKYPLLRSRQATRPRRGDVAVSGLEQLVHIKCDYQLERCGQYSAIRTSNAHRFQGLSSIDPLLQLG